MRHYDVIVLGTGAVGSAALYHLAQRGARVLGLDRFPPGHDRGSAHGESRMIRMSYFEHADYVPLLRLAYSLWDELAQTRGEGLFRRTGLLYFGAREGTAIRGVLESARRYRLVLEELESIDLEKAYPGFVVPSGAAVVFEPDAGYLLVEACVKAYLDQAVKLGAEHRHGEAISGWSANDRGVRVTTDRGEYQAGRMVVTLGSWAGGLLGQLGIRLRILRKHMHWFKVDDECYLATKGCPCFFYDVGGGYFYGFPSIGSWGLKISEHSGGTEISDPLQDQREPESLDSDRVRAFLRRYLPGVSSEQTRHDVCFYSMSPDEHFIVDHHPEHSSVVFAAGLSGHGFKFASALGRVLSELSLDGASSTEVGFLGLNRPGLQREWGEHPPEP